MLTFNLLPTEQKEEIEKERLYLIGVGILKSLFLALLIVFFLLLSADFSLKFLSSDQKRSLEEIKKDKLIKDMIALDDQVLKSNDFIDKVYSAQKDIVYFSTTIEKISALVPSGIYFTELTIEKKTQGETTATSPAAEGDSSEETQSQTTPTPTTTTATETNNQQQEQQQYYEVKISGIAKKREQVIIFEKNLRSQSEFMSLVSPLQNILKAQEVEFEFSFKLK
ncbi:MAG: hypothetical protein PHI88_00630 [Candidatus Pacebacteria bacterium]|nr:hypothetical protein [Candidatus Paceibacterota bacterium]